MKWNMITNRKTIFEAVDDSNRVDVTIKVKPSNDFIGFIQNARIVIETELMYHIHPYDSIHAGTISFKKELVDIELEEKGGS